MCRTITRFLLIFCVGASVLGAAERPDVYPFDVKLASVLAKHVEGKPYARVDGTVPADAEIEVGVPKGQIIINVFPSDPDGNVAQGVQPAVIIIQNDNKGRLNALTMGPPVTGGFHLMNAVAEGKTARVVFEVKAAGSKK
ncbi:MAG: hypothetical protein HY815_33795 [Candidatus Riflebacteria bacterium]|nr:hypothetical protein [Candidatus Riflebacteria bacterium]